MDEQAPVCANQEVVLLLRELWRRDDTRPRNDVLIFCLEIDGIDPRRCERALMVVAQRHSALRTSIRRSSTVAPSARLSRLQRFARTGLFEPGLYHQIVHEHAEIIVDRIDLVHLGEPEQARILQELVARWPRESCNTECTLPLRAVVAALSGRRQALMVGVDHLLCDRYGLEIVRHELVAELTQEYQPARGSTNSPAQYSEYAASTQRPTIRDVAFWAAQWTAHCGHRLRPVDIPFMLPSDRRRTSTSALDVANLDPLESRELRHACAAQRATLHMLTVTAYGIVLCIYTGLANVAVWTHFANRTDRRFKGTVGWLANTHIVNINAPSERPILEVLAEVKASMLAALEHQSLSLPAMWRALGSHPKYLDAFPLVDVYPHTKAVLTKRVRSRPLPEANVRRRSSVGVYLHDDGETFRLASRYAAHIYSSEGVRAMLEDIRAVLRALSRGNIRVGDLTAIAARYRAVERAAPSEMSEVVATAVAECNCDCSPIASHDTSSPTRCD